MTQTLAERATVRVKMAFAIIDNLPSSDHTLEAAAKASQRMAYQQ